MPETRSDTRDVLHALRRRRLTRRMRNLDWVDTLYKAYVTAIVGLSALFGAAALVGDARLAAGTVDRLGVDGPALVGLAVAVAVMLGLRSGSRGGPLAFEPAELQHVLLAPVDRGVVVRSSAYRQLRGVGVAAVVGGALVGVLAAQRIPHAGPDDTAEWVGAGVVAAVAVLLAVWGSALVASGLRLRPYQVLLVGAGLIGWSALDAAAGTITSPLSWIGAVAVWPLDPRPGAVIGVLASAAVVTAGLILVSGLSLESAQQRAGIVAALRFAATIQDLRVVILLHRQLANERARTRPWIRLPSGSPVGRAAWRRDWQGVLRWPAARVGRVAALGAVAGVAAYGAGRGTTPLVLVAGIALYVAALDAVEGLAQEIDHPDRAAGLPLEPGMLYLRHLAVPGAVMLATSAVGLLVAGALDPGDVPTGLVTAVVVAITAAATAGLAVWLAAPGFGSAVVMLHPGIGVLRQVAPPVLVVLAFAPVVAARAAAGSGGSPSGAAVAASLPALIASAGIVTFLGSRRAPSR